MESTGTYEALKKKELAERFGFKNLQKLYDFTEYLSGAKVKVIKTYYEDEEGPPYVEILYTDGDSGVLVFEGSSEMYERDGVTISSPISQWADISYNAMYTIQEILRTFADGYDSGCIIWVDSN